MVRRTPSEQSDLMRRSFPKWIPKAKTVVLWRIWDWNPPVMYLLINRMVYLTMYFTCILKSSKDFKYYYGHTNDLAARLKSHNSGKVRSTKSRRPFVLHYSEAYQDRSTAFKREQFFKSIDGYNWLRNQCII